MSSDASSTTVFTPPIASAALASDPIANTATPSAAVTAVRRQRRRKRNAWDETPDDTAALVATATPPTTVPNGVLPAATTAFATSVPSISNASAATITTTAGTAAIEPPPPMLPVLSEAQTALLGRIKAHIAETTLAFQKERSARFGGMQTPGQYAAMVRAKIQRALLLLGRVYVGGLISSVTEASVRHVFSQFGHVHTVVLTPGDSKRRGYCFVEYDCPESAVLAIEWMNDYGFEGAPVRCSRPANVADTAMSYLAPLRAQAKAKNRIFVSSLNSRLQEEEIRDVFAVFGPIMDMTMPRTLSSGAHRSYCWIDYATETAANEAVDNMNLYDLGGHHLHVCFAVSRPLDIIDAVSRIESSGLVAPQKPSSAVVAQETTAAASEATAQQASGESSSEEDGGEAGGESGRATKRARRTGGRNQPAKRPTGLDADSENVSISGAAQRAMLMQKLARKMSNREASNVIVLRDMVEPADVDDVLEGEIRQECAKFGAVVRVVVHVTVSPDAVSIIVAFRTREGADRAIGALNGRYFAGNTVRAEKYDETLFLAGDYTG